jgi:hypothetical protein
MAWCMYFCRFWLLYCMYLFRPLFIMNWCIPVAEDFLLEISPRCSVINYTITNWRVSLSKICQEWPNNTVTHECATKIIFQGKHFNYFIVVGGWLHILWSDTHYSISLRYAVISIGVLIVYIDTGSSMPISPSKSRDLADENNNIFLLSLCKIVRSSVILLLPLLIYIGSSYRIYLIVSIIIWPISS